MAFRPSASEPLKHEITAHARLFQCSFGNGSVGGTVLRPTNVPRSSGALGRKSRNARMTALPSFAASQKIGPANTMLHRMRLEEEARDDAEVAAAAAQRPEEIRMLLAIRGDEAAVGEDDIGLEEVVDGEPELARQVPGAAAQREPGHARAADDPERHGQAESVRRVVDVRGAATRLHPHGPGGGVDPHALHHATGR